MIVEIDCGIQKADLDIERFKNLSIAICRRFDVTDAVVSIAIVDDKEITDVNEKFLQKSNTTDVISFDLTEPDASEKVFDLVINADEAARQAEKRAHPLNAELALYITHGLLHNLGLNDADEEDARRMHRTEDDILTEAGYGAIYRHG
jgi:probable rRNA maturation factor